MELDLSDNFILFCGPNSTGKTYASYILNAFLSNNSIKALTCYNDILNQLKKDSELKISKKYIDEWLDASCQDIKSQLGSILGISEETKNNLFSNFDLQVSCSEEDYNKIIEYRVDTILLNDMDIVDVTKEPGSDIVNIKNITGDFLKLLDEESIKTKTFVNRLLFSVALPGHYESRMLTVERNSIYTFKTELSLSRNALVDRIQLDRKDSDKDIISLIQNSSRRYPYAVRESLRVANDLENIQKVDGEYLKIAEDIESNLLHGKVSMTKGGDVEFSTSSSTDTRKLPFHLSSSIVKTMASLVIYLRHIASKGDTLIVDEPEMNFHPDVQILLARIFAKLSNTGLHVVISTHSDYIIREVNNMIMAGVLVNKGRDKEAEECGYGKDYTLDKNTVEVIYFNPDSKTGYVETQTLEIKDDGFEVTSIDDAIIKQNQRTDNLYDCING